MKSVAKNQITKMYII